MTEVCNPEGDGCTYINLAASSLRDSLPVLSADYNVARKIMNLDSIPEYSLTDSIMTYSIGSIIVLLKSELYETVFGLVLDSLTGDDESNMELDTSLDRRFYHFIKVMSSKATELIVELAEEIS